MTNIFDFGKKFRKAIAFGAVGIGALGVAISSVLKPKQDYDDYVEFEDVTEEEPNNDEEHSDFSDESESE